jgi:hypothetical protein
MNRSTRRHVKIVLDLLINAGLRIKIDKCDFGVTEMELLGFKVSDQGISPSPRALRGHPRPEC